jgi:Mg2+/citrate symporter
LLIAITFFIGYSVALISNFKKVDEKEKEIRKLKVKLEDLKKSSDKNS